MDKINVTYPSFCVPSPPTFSLLSYFPTFFSFLICMPDYELALLLKDCNFVCCYDIFRGRSIGNLVTYIQRILIWLENLSQISLWKNI